MPQFLVVVMEIIKSRVKTNAGVNRETQGQREKRQSIISRLASTSESPGFFISR